MANEITIGLTFDVRKDNLQFTYAPGTFSLTMTGTGGPTPGYVTIGTTEEQVQFTELGTEGWLVLQNLDATNYVRWGFATGVYGGRVEAGEVALFRLNPAASIFMIADTAAVKMLVLGFED
jgi:hypothetical protein